ncbi:MAG: hypothetical protein KDF60_10325 [Calditrichaeota bacterium]|nr:hypothetical protein [Calditrichota bacterium]
MDTKTFLTSLNSFSDEILKNTVDQYTTLLKKHVDDFFQAGKMSFTAKDKELVFCETADQLLSVSEKLNKQISRSKEEILSLAVSAPWTIFDEKYAELKAGMQQQAALPYDDLPEDSTVSKFKKSRYSRNQKRYLKQKTEQRREAKARKFSVLMFVEFFPNNALKKHIYEENKYFLNVFSKILNDLHSASENLKDEIVAARSSGQEEKYLKRLKTQGVSTCLIEYLNALDTVINTPETYKNSAVKRQQDFSELQAKTLSKNWQVAGSPLLPASEFSKSKCLKSDKKLNEKFSKSSKKWKIHLEGSCQDWQKDLQIGLLQISIAKEYLENLDKIENIINKSVGPVFKEVNRVVLSSREKFKGDGDPDFENLKKIIVTENRSLIRELRLTKLPALHDTLVQTAFDKTYLIFLESTKAAVADLNNEYVVFKKCDLQNLPPQSEIDEVPVKDLIEKEILTKAFVNQQQLSQNYKNKIQPVLRNVVNLDQIVEFNLEAALNLLKEKTDKENLHKAHKIAVEGLDRAETNIRDLQKNFIQIVETANNNFDDIVFELESDIQKLGDNEKILELKLRLARAQTKQKLIQTRHNIWLKIKNSVPRIIDKLKKIYTKIQLEYLRISKVTGLGPQDEISHEVISDFLVNTERKIKRMPYVYQRLFRLEPLEETRFFYGRKEQMQVLKEATERFKQGHSVSAVIIAEKGNGKTTLLQFAEKDYFRGLNTVKIDFDKSLTQTDHFIKMMADKFNLPTVKTSDQLAAEIRKNDVKMICVLENVHNLFLRVIDGFNIFEHLLLIMSQTRNQIFWVTTCGLYAWEYLDKVLKLSDYFNTIIQLPALNSDELHQIIINRHQVSGYGLNFEPTEKIKRSRAFKKLTDAEEQQQYLQNNLFENLQEISGGNIKSAILFWLSGINSFEDEKINLSAEIKLDTSLIYRLSSEELFSLAAFIQHEFLSEEQHSAVFNQSIVESRLIISRLVKKGYLGLSGDEYYVHPLLYRPVVKVLRNKNIL